METEYPGTFVGWHEARDFCQLNGGDMVSLHSQEESDFFMSLVGRLDFILKIINVNEASSSPQTMKAIHQGSLSDKIMAI